MDRKKVASFVSYGRTEENNRRVRLYKNQHGLYVCDIEGMPALTITHPSYERVRAAFKVWWQMSQKDWGASEIEWGDYES